PLSSNVSVAAVGDPGWLVAEGMNDSESLLLKLDPSGNVLWTSGFFASSLGGSYSGVPIKVGDMCASSDGGALFLRTDTQNGVELLSRLDRDGRTLWDHTYYPTHGNNGAQLARTSDGGCYLCVAMNRGIAVVKLDGSSSVVWSKRLTHPSPAYRAAMV